ncbi:MAG TPA: DUF4239 domain-containing protein [Methylovirgula sp.]|nr:DUF4239 domain-containing protein [Methylovirgula sp.]
MGYFAAASIIAGAALLAVLVTIFIQRVIEVDLRRKHHDVGSTVFLQLGVVFAVLLAFVFSEAWGEYNQAAGAIDLEVGALHAIGMIAATLPGAQAKPILSEERSYVESVIDEEWPVMAAHRTAYLGTQGKLQTLLQEVANLRLPDDQRDKKAELLSLMAEAHAQRESRIFQAGSGIPGALWVVLIVFTATLALFVAMSEIPYSSTAAIIAACFAAGITSILVLARLLDYPFEGALALHPDDFAGLLGKISALLGHSGA